MAAVLLLLGLIAAGIYTGSVGFYIAAGALVGVWILFTLVVTVFIGSKVRDIKKDFDKGFDSDFFKNGPSIHNSPRIRNRRRF